MVNPTIYSANRSSSIQNDFKVEIVKKNTKARGGGDVRSVRRVMPSQKPTTVNNETQVETTNDRGDSGKRTISKKEVGPKRDLGARIPTKEVQSRYMVINQSAEHQHHKISKVFEKKSTWLKPLDIESRRRLCKMYTFRNFTCCRGSNDTTAPVNDDNKSIATCHTGSESSKNRQPVDSDHTTVGPENRISDVASNTKTNDTILSEQSFSNRTAVIIESNTASKEESPRKPIIKTVIQKERDGPKVFKSVLFVDQPKRQPLKINMNERNVKSRSEYAQSRRPSDSGDSTVCTSAPENTVKPRRNTLPKPVLKKLPEKRFPSMKKGLNAKQPASPPSEAKWVSVDNHIEPYYAAWVDTTLTAISLDKNRMQNEKLKIIHNLVERAKRYHQTCLMSCEGMTDERYVGRIRVKNSQK